MGQKLLKYYDEAKKIGGLTAQIRLAVITKIPGNKAEAAPDLPESLAKFEAAINEIRKNLNHDKK
jgi:hypothetical protein